MRLDPEQAPWPSEWKAGPKASHVLIGGFLLLIAVGSLLGGIGGLTSGTTGTAFLLPFSLLLFVIAVLPAFAYLRCRSVDTWQLSVEWVEQIGAYAVWIPYSRRASRGYVLILGLSAVALLGVVVLAPLVPPEDSRLLVLWFGSLFLLGWLGWVAIAMARGTAARGWLALTPDAVVHRGWGTTTIVPWDGVALVGADTVKLNAFLVLAVPDDAASHRVVHSRAAQGPEDNLRPHLAVRPRMLMVDPAVLYHALHFYHAVPEARSELANGQAIERMRRCDLGAPPH